VQIAASAPTRIDLAGGTIDIWPLYLFHDGASTVNAAISLRAHAAVAARADGGVELHSIDAGRRTCAPGWADLTDGGGLTLLTRLARHYRLENASLTTRGESPAGAGIAGSSALTIAACAALARFTGAAEGAEDLLQVAMNVECQTIRVPTGVQDYRPAFYGGVAAIELRPDGIHRVPLDVDASELERRIVLAYTGAPATRAPTTGRSPSATSTATRTSSTASSGSATPPRPYARRSGGATGTRSGGRSAWNGRIGSGSRRASRHPPSTT
jgi:D-glycero-alpha-D-manno-heptose-7-phosphate kinase